MQNQQLAHLCQQCITIAHQAGRAILKIYEADFQVRQKSDNTPLTEADMAAHHCITEALQALTPAIPILSEESARPAYSERQLWKTYWLIDPLDGTREFVHRNGEFTVNIALIHHHKSILGVIHVPVTGTNYFAWQGGGSFRENNGVTRPIQTRKMEPGAPLTVVSSRSHPSPRLQNFLKPLGKVEQIHMGSSLKFCLVAEGNADLYPRLSPTAEWDTAAAHCIVEQAGGFLRQTNGSELLYNTKNSLLNPDFLVFTDMDLKWLKTLLSR